MPARPEPALPQQATACNSAVLRQFEMVGGVDTLKSDQGPMVLELNSSPGLGGIERATGRNIADKIIQFIERNARHGRTRTRGEK